MKKEFYLLSTFLILSFLTHAQSIPISNGYHDQIVQGPCYIFATVAALESKAIQSGFPDVDFYEWNLYSTDVLGSRTGNGDVMVQKSILNAKNYGIYNRDNTYQPSGIFGLPNANDPQVKGIADFTSCGSLKNNFYSINPFEGNCIDDDGKKFILEPFIDYKYTYNYSGSGYISDTSPNELEMKGHLNNGKGLIAFFNDWDGAGTAHAVFIYGYSGSNWNYKDSWPGNPGNKTTSLDISKCTKYYYLTGDITSNAPLTCQANISGPSTVSGNTTYTIPSGYSSVNWSKSGNLSIVSSNSTSITVKPSSCSLGFGTINVSYYDNGSICNKSKSVTVTGSSQKPDGISVLSPNWSNGQTCPNTTLELEVIDNSNPSYPQTTYDWSISGATLLSGNGTPTIFINTSSNPGTTYLTFKVRAKNGSCSYSSWRTIYGTSSTSNCGGGGAFYAYEYGGNLRLIGFDREANSKEIEYQIVNLNGSILQKGLLDRNLEIDIRTIKKELVIIQFYDQALGSLGSIKFIKR